MKFTSAFIVALASLQTATAGPIEAREEYPEVVPGPGLPSLESLGLTTAQLYEMPVPEKSALPSKVRRAGTCGPGSAYTNVNGIIACYNYLNGLGTANCAVPGKGVTNHMCSSGDAVITGQSLAGGGTSSYCRDVAAAVLWTINSCTRSDQTCAGAQFAGGNGDLSVGAYSAGYA
ncbi:hypothetical protein P153DRAFT_308806 [Dothidotthia symphoricarpi CBS 119687]|uniref:Uncharacterized protein n=1 Tax=Dothidotthia symphoricarpi CBS 119687 TaxID=1392245 RepID=A0A6A6AN62_9PLEO|nr:uncharacterized protein P153DRAFT_308806 [Dothidotthia symphoricarpi CBS 119687]KAF2132495.1 hypothetical protein P153DRAFT_308806 [Dothidotthia symphoricarpi CBS 119687]